MWSAIAGTTTVSARPCVTSTGTSRVGRTSSPSMWRAARWARTCAGTVTFQRTAVSSSSGSIGPGLALACAMGRGVALRLVAGAGGRRAHPGRRRANAGSVRPGRHPLGLRGRAAACGRPFVQDDGRLSLFRRHPAVPASLVLVGGHVGWAASLPPDEVARRVEVFVGTAELARRSTRRRTRGLCSELIPADRDASLAAIMRDTSARHRSERRVTSGQRPISASPTATERSGRCRHRPKRRPQPASRIGPIPPTWK